MKRIAFFIILMLPQFLFALPKILVFGDSLSAAYKIPASSGWVQLLETRLKEKHEPYDVVNASISGETTKGGLKRLPTHLRAEQPAIVIIELGGNDGLRGFRPAIVKDNIAKMIALCQEHQAQVLLAGIKLPVNLGKAYTKQFNEIYGEIAKEYKVKLIPFILEGVVNRRGYMMADGIHPTEKAQPLILNNVWRYLKPML